MENKLPIYKIKGVPFTVEVEYCLLRHTIDRRNIIEFSDMMNMGTHYEIDFDPITGIADIYGDGGEGLQRAKIPQMVKLDPERVAKMYNMKVSELPEHDSQLQTNKEWYNLRLKRKLPTIRIHGHDYFANVRQRTLEPKDLHNDFIMLHDLQRDPTNTYYFGMLDTKSMSVIPYDNEITSIPENAVMIRIPHERILDPFVELEDMGWSNFPERLGKFPLRYDMEATVMEWKDTPIPKLIVKNLRRQKREKKGKKRGKGQRI